MNKLILLLIILFGANSLAQADDSHYVLDLNYGQGQAAYRTMSDAYVPFFAEPNLSQAQDFEIALYDREAGNFLIGGGLNYMTNRYTELGNTVDHIDTDFLSLMFLFKWFPFSKGQRWFYVQWGIGFAGSKGDGVVDDGTDYKLKGFGGAVSLGAGLAIPVSKDIEVHVGIQMQGVAVTDFVVPYSGVGAPMLNFGIMF
jgi:hypothetical protein